jgi:DNA-directed RNA polymerase
LQPGLALMKRHIGPVAKRIEQFVKECNEGRAGKGASVGFFLEQFDADVVAYMALRKIIAGLATRVPLTRFASSIGSYFEDSSTSTRSRRKRPGLYRQLQKRIAARKDAGVRHVVLRRQAKYAGIKTVTWDQTSKVKLGVRLIDFVAEETGLIQVVQIALAARTRRSTCSPRRALSRGLSRRITAANSWRPRISRWWCRRRRGAPRSTAATSRSASRSSRFAIAPTSRNSRRRTCLTCTRRQRAPEHPLACQRRHPRHLKEVWDSGRSTGGLPPRDSLPLPASLPESDFTLKDDFKAAERAAKEHGLDEPLPTEEQKAIGRIKAWKPPRTRSHTENMRLESKRMSLTQKIWLAEKFGQYEAIYFPWVLDWRGRAYPVPARSRRRATTLPRRCLSSPRASLSARTARTGSRFMAPTATAWTRLRFEERVKWVEENAGLIADCAVDPLANQHWAEADSPWQFLAFCKEWARPADSPQARQAHGGVRLAPPRGPRWKLQRPPELLRHAAR